MTEQELRDWCAQKMARHGPRYTSPCLFSGGTLVKQFRSNRAMRRAEAARPEPGPWATRAEKRAAQRGRRVERRRQRLARRGQR